MIGGIDFSSFQVDVVLLSEDDDTATHHVFPFGRKGQDAFDRARGVRAAMPTRSWWEDHGTVAIGIEDPRGAARGVDSVLYRVQGAILACLPPELLVQPWKPGEWRKQLGIANVGKEAPAIFAESHWSRILVQESYSQDALDAYCLAYATRQRLVIGEAAA
jgi:hypothetical protein